MLFTDSEELRSILWPRIESSFLEGYYGGTINEAHDKFYAATLVKISDIEYDDFEYLHDLLGGHTSMFHDHERRKKFITPDSWQTKSTRELINEGVYLYFSVSFMGVLFEGEWFILKSLSFYGDEKKQDELKSYIEKPDYYRDDFWNDALFLPKKALKHNRLGKKVPIRSIQFEEFKDTPYLVAIVKQEKKEKINRLFISYFSEEFMLPFFEKLKITHPSDYYALCPLRVDYVMIFPVHKKHIIFCAFVSNTLEKWRLKYFLFNYEDRQFYEWNYFQSEEYDSCFFYGDLIINDLKTISHWDDLFFLDSSCTMDDETFWSEYVFKKNGDSFLYLTSR